MDNAKKIDAFCVIFMLTQHGKSTIILKQLCEVRYEAELKGHH